MDMERKAEETALNSSTQDVEAQTPPQLPKPKSKSKSKKHRRRNICLAVTAATILAIVLVGVILAFTYFKPKDPNTIIDTITLQNLRVSLDTARRINLNMTLDVDLTVTNPNKVGFKYKNGSALLNYRGELVGNVPLPAGDMGADETRPMNVSVTVMADRMLANPQLYSDVMSGLLTMTSVVKLSGKVAIFKIFKIGVDATATCDVGVFLANATIADMNCKYKAKI